jgi:hypothetical protein
MQATEVAIIIGAVGTMVVSVFVAFGKWSSSNEKIAERARVAAQERATCEREIMFKMFTESLELLATATEKNTKAQERTADEAKVRNGHLAEAAVKTQELVVKSQEMIDRNLKAYEEMTSQHITRQLVDTQTIKNIK